MVFVGVGGMLAGCDECEETPSVPPIPESEVCSDMPTSGFELEFNEDIWNDLGPKDDESNYAPAVQITNNCYSYAFNDCRIHEDYGENNHCDGREKMCKPNPGVRVGKPFYAGAKSIKDIEEMKTCDNIIEAAGRDAAASGESFVPCGKMEKCTLDDDSAKEGKKAYKVALYIAPKKEYHWYRQDKNGCWSHKPGWGRVSQKDPTDIIISDPDNSNRQFPEYNYSKLCGFFCVTVKGETEGIKTECECPDLP
jgi:hypothetical protein